MLTPNARPFLVRLGASEHRAPGLCVQHPSYTLSACFLVLRSSRRAPAGHPPAIHALPEASRARSEEPPSWQGRICSGGVSDGQNGMSTRRSRVEYRCRGCRTVRPRAIFTQLATEGTGHRCGTRALRGPSPLCSRCAALAAQTLRCIMLCRVTQAKLCFRLPFLLRSACGTARGRLPPRRC